MSLFKVNKRLYDENSDPQARIFVNQGGTSSGKTYCIMQRLISIAVNEPATIITVAGQDLPNLKVGAMRDTETIFSDSEWLQGFFTWNRSDYTIKGQNGSLIEFKSYDGEQDAKNGKRDYLFINEANGIAYGIYWQLAIRTRRQIFIDYNPSARFWVHEQVLGREGVKLIISDHRSNMFLTDEEHRRIEGISDPELWKVYARGKTGSITGLVFSHFNVVDDLPPREEWKVSAWGLDWGFSADPTALVHLVLAHGEIWTDEVIYRTGMTNPDIAQAMKEAGLTGRDEIVADSAEPKSITELNRMGYFIKPCKKGADSISNGIDILKRYTWNVTRRSAGLRKELLAYKWKIDRNGDMTNQPIDAFNHAIDAVRYAASETLGVRTQPRGVKVRR